MALVFYIICGLFFFVFNLNYFYPAYMARQLVKEEAIAMNDTLQKFTNKSQGFIKPETLKELTELATLKNGIKAEYVAPEIKVPPVFDAVLFLYH